jgi:hypothetical protein
VLSGIYEVWLGWRIWMKGVEGELVGGDLRRDGCRRVKYRDERELTRRELISSIMGRKM